MEKQMTSRDRQAQATKKKIYKVGIKLIQKYGLDGINVSQIAKAAGISVGTFYHYYKSKLDLFMDLYRSADDRYENELAAQISGLPFDEKIQAFFRDYAEMAENNGVQLTQKMYIPENTLFISEDRAMHTLLKNVISDAQKKGLCSVSKSPEDTADDLFLIARGVIFDWALHKGSYDLKEKIKEMLSFYTDRLAEK